VKATQMMRQFSDVAAERGLPMEELWKWSNKEGFSCLTEYFSFFCCICWVRFSVVSIYRDNPSSSFSSLIYSGNRRKLSWSTNICSFLLFVHHWSKSTKLLQLASE
jgi:hypothetical protein